MHIIRQGGSSYGYTADLAQPGEPGLQVRQGALQHFTVARILGGFELLEHMPAGQHEPLPLALPG